MHILQHTYALFEIVDLVSIITITTNHLLAEHVLHYTLKTTTGYWQQ